MPYPAEYQQATIRFQEFLCDAKAEADFGSVHMAYTMVQGVFQVFRRRLTLSESVIFLSALNAGMRALYTADWDPSEKQLPFGTMENMNEEVLLLRPNHNYSPENAIQITARAVWKNVDKEKFEEALKQLPEWSVEFWRVE